MFLLGTYFFDCRNNISRIIEVTNPRALLFLQTKMKRLIISPEKMRRLIISSEKNQHFFKNNEELPFLFSAYFFVLQK